MAFTPTATDDPLLLTLEHVAWHLGVTPAELRKLIRAGEIPVVRVFTRLLVRRSDLEAWIARLVPEVLQARAASDRIGTETPPDTAR